MSTSSARLRRASGHDPNKGVSPIVDAPSAAAFLAAHDPQVRGHVCWGALRLRVASYLCARLPPPELITSVRAVMLRAGQVTQVMVVRDPERLHTLPGGRREHGESLEQTLRRELLEETGWAVDPPHLLGVMQFTHRDPKPVDYAYPDYLYPDFFQAVYVAYAHSFHPQALELDGYELGAAFRPIADVESLVLPANERLFLDAALKWHGRR